VCVGCVGGVPGLGGSQTRSAGVGLLGGFVTGLGGVVIGGGVFGEGFCKCWLRSFPRGEGGSSDVGKGFTSSVEGELGFGVTSGAHVPGTGSLAFSPFRGNEDTCFEDLREWCTGGTTCV
jgi:hypothetical protein